MFLSNAVIVFSQTGCRYIKGLIYHVYISELLEYLEMLSIRQCSRVLAEHKISVRSLSSWNPFSRKGKLFYQVIFLSFFERKISLYTSYLQLQLLVNQFIVDFVILQVLRALRQCSIKLGYLSMIVLVELRSGWGMTGKLA